MELLRCSACGQMKEPAAFHRVQMANYAHRGFRFGQCKICRKEGRRRGPVTAICQYPPCGKEFQYTSSLPRHTCSERCGRALRRTKALGRRLGRQKAIFAERMCPCGEWFVPFGPREQFCSDLCKRRAYSARDKGLDSSAVVFAWGHHDGFCDACGRPDRGRMELDHSHKNGSKLPRGIIHSTCNKALAFADDDPEILAAWIDYVVRHNVMASYPLLELKGA